MPKYLKIIDDTKQSILLIEAPDEPASIGPISNKAPDQGTIVDDSSGVPVDMGAKVGARDLGRKVVTEIVTETQAAFEQALTKALEINASMFLTPILAMERPPSEVEVSFDLKVTAEAGFDHLAVSKAGGEAAYGIKMVWKDLKK